MTSTRQRQGAAAQLRRRLLGERQVEVADRDPAALADQRRRRRLADPAGAAGDRHDLAAECAVAPSPSRSPLRPASGGRLVDGDHGGAAEADVVLEGDLGAVDLALVGVAAQLPGQLGALREAGRPERVALGDQPAGGVDDDLAAVGGRLFLDQLVALALGGEAERFVGDQLVGAEAVVQLADVDLLGGDAGLLVGRGRRRSSTCRSRRSSCSRRPRRRSRRGR